MVGGAGFNIRINIEEVSICQCKPSTKMLTCLDNVEKLKDHESSLFY